MRPLSRKAAQAGYRRHWRCAADYRLSWRRQLRLDPCRPPRRKLRRNKVMSVGQTGPAFPAATTCPTPRPHAPHPSLAPPHPPRPPPQRRRRPRRRRHPRRGGRPSHPSARRRRRHGVRGPHRRGQPGPGIPAFPASSSRTAATSPSPADGRYTLPLPEEATIFVIKPAGFMPPVEPLTNLPRFYRIHQPKGSPAELNLAFEGLAPTRAFAGLGRFPAAPPG